MFDEENDSNILPASVREYIGALVKKMRYRRIVREDVRAEITAHFEDELVDCRTEEEKEKKQCLLVLKSQSVLGVICVLCFALYMPCL